MYGLAFMRTPFMVRFFRGPFCFRIIRSPFLVRKSLSPYPDSDFYGIRYVRLLRNPFYFRIIRSPFLVRKSLNPYPDSDFYGIRYLPDKKSVFSGRLFSLWGTRISTIFSSELELAGLRHFYTDASGDALGVWSDREWAVSLVPPGVIVGPYSKKGLSTDPASVRVSSGLAEAAAILMLLLIWAVSCKGQHIVVHTDSSTVVGAWAGQSSSSPRTIAPYIRAFAHICSMHDITLTIVHIPGVLNFIADAISRLQWSNFRRFHPSALPEPLPAPSADRLWLL